ncbi:hypothetical protein RHMOL_Rhmol05G0293100 [Rhododendron molle]|uniref:Uncharacterized protein n=1 Tax=Rhododendron molle TaxID=49168 RepID=A0ACC0NVJ0_RHOML|nr:hypothetical protein RHMOL_Rhmol05G0293100 [Rhododendron molle]
MISGEEGWISLGPWGGKGGVYSTYKFCIDIAVEQLSSISLTYKDYYGRVVIKSLCFETNIGNKYGPFGSESGASSVSIPIEGRLIAGFHGRGGSFLDAFGIFVAPKPKVTFYPLYCFLVQLVNQISHAHFLSHKFVT